MRLIQLWKDHHCEEYRQYSAQQLAGQVNSVLRTNVFTDLELAELMRVANTSTRETSCNSEWICNCDAFCNLCISLTIK